MRKNAKRALAVSAVTALLFSTWAYAYWRNSGSGAGTATTGSNAPITVNQTTVLTGMYPGQGAQTLAGTFANPNPGPVYVAAVAANPVVTIDAGHALCLPESYTMGGAALVGAEVPVGTGGAWTGLTIQMNNLATNQDACKGATVTIAYTSS